MTTDKREDHPPGDDASYGTMLGYWMNVMGMSDGALARGISVDRSYTGYIRRGRKLPSPEMADLIRKHLLVEAEQPGWNEGRRLTVSDGHRMDELLRASFDRSHRSRQQMRPLREPAKARDPHALLRLMEELKLTKDDVERLRSAWEQDENYSARGVPALALTEGVGLPASIGEETGADADGAADPPPNLPEVTLHALPEAQELEALIALMGDGPAADDMVRTRVMAIHLFALGLPDQLGLAHLLHITAPVGGVVIPMLPVFTRLEHVLSAVKVNPSWRELQVLEVEGALVLGDLDFDSMEWLGINLWSGHEFKLPAAPPEARMD
jgi:hypothetical protein